MARWMVNQGAINIALVSRTASLTGKVKELTEEMATLGANIVVRRCDVSDSKAVDHFITEELVGLPVVRGVIHGAMVLHVSFHKYVQLSVF